MSITVLDTYRVLYYDKNKQRVGGDYGLTREEAGTLYRAWITGGGIAYGSREIDLGLVPICDFGPSMTARARETEQAAEQRETERSDLFIGGLE